MRPNGGLSTLFTAVFLCSGLFACGGNEDAGAPVPSTPAGNSSTPSATGSATGSTATATPTTVATGSAANTGTIPAATGTVTGTGSALTTGAASGTSTPTGISTTTGTGGSTSTPSAATAGAPLGTGTTALTDPVTGTAITGSTTLLAAVTRVDSVSAPADGAAVSGTVQIAITGTNLAHAELLPANNAQPLLGRLAVSADGSSATLSFDTQTVPNGTLTVRITASSTAPGSAAATETTAMTPRTWRFSNDPPPTGNDAGRTARCQQMNLAATPPDPDNPVVCVSFAHTSTPIAQCTSFGTGYGNPENLLEVLRNGSPVSKLYCQPGANNGVLNSGCFCLS